VIILTEELIELGKKNAAIKAIEENVKENMIIGIGSGSTIVYAVKRLGEINKEKDLKLKCIPSSFQAHQLIIQNGLELGSLERYPEIDVDIDGADEIDKNLNLIKGGGGCLVQEKIIASNSKRLIIIADFRKRSERLGKNWKYGVPVEVIPMAHFPIMKKLKELGGNPKLRMAKSKSGPVITDNGNFIIDVDFGEISHPQELDEKIRDGKVLILEKK